VIAELLGHCHRLDVSHRVIIGLYERLA